MIRDANSLPAFEAGSGAAKRNRAEALAVKPSGSQRWRSIAEWKFAQRSRQRIQSL